jgi:hypothetical protein
MGGGIGKKSPPQKLKYLGGENCAITFYRIYIELKKGIKMLKKYQLILIFAFFLSAFKLGYEASKANFFPIGKWYKLNYGEKKIESPKAPDVFTDTSNRVKIECPKVNDSVIVVAFGQSNSANYAGQRYESKNNSVVNFYNGSCYVAKDPMLGATGNAGSIWIPFGKKLTQKTGKKVVLVTFGVGGTSINRWTDSNDLGGFMDVNLSELKSTYGYVNYFLWVQGESDKGLDSSKYESQLASLIKKTKMYFPSSKFMLSATTYCGGSDDSAINATQKNISNKLPNVFLLGDTDKYTSSIYRYDDCHFSGLGVEAIASEFLHPF